MRAVRRAGPARGVAKAREDALHDGSDARLRGRRAGVLDASAREHALDDLLHRRVEVAPPRARLEQHAPTPEPHPRDEARGEGEQKRGPRGVRDGSNRLPAAQRGVVPRHVVVLHLVPGRPKRPTRATSMCNSPERSWASIHSSRQTRDRGAPRIRTSVRRLAGATFLRYHSKPVRSRFEKRRAGGPRRAYSRSARRPRPARPLQRVPRVARRHAGKMAGMPYGLQSMLKVRLSDEIARRPVRAIVEKVRPSRDLADAADRATRPFPPHPLPAARRMATSTCPASTRP